MKKIPLGSTGRTTTQLGFGCSGMMGALSRSESLRLLSVAYETGIRHFDVAPSYGYGEAERCLGDFLKGKNDVTVTTKYGIIPPKNQTFVSLARKFAGPIVRKIPAFKRRLGRVAQSMQQDARFSADEARISLEKSLRELQRDHLDIWLLHEPSAAQLQDDGLLNYLQECVVAGKIGTFGIGGEGSKVSDLCRQRCAYCPVLQFEWSILNAVPDLPGTLRIHHRALSQLYPVLMEKLSRNPALRKRWSEAIGYDLSPEPALSRLMLKASLEMNPDSVILFSSRNPSNILQNVATCEDTALNASARRFYELFQSESGFAE